MADLVDLAAEHIEKVESLASRYRVPNVIQPQGHCHFCKEEVAEGKLFCDVDCARDWSREEKAKARNGRRDDS